MFSKILIANRGEIACRVIKTAKKMGIQTVVVYSDADANAQFVHLADEAYALGGVLAKDSYLKADKILEIAKTSQAQAIHPGYGFLSENEAFANACELAGIVFIGPPASAIESMGSKSRAKALMQQANVPLVPGYHGDNQAPDFLSEQANQIGYPVLIKASAGGGGKGMRVVDCEANFLTALESCKREALSSFNDDHVLIEKYLTQSRHIEIQVFADNFGNCVYLFERDCSIQRRHQKVVEEAPAPHFPNHLREQMGDAACRAALAVGYTGAGTVEFIFDELSQAFYFMEMNTRLQVEHPITEMISQQDLVEWQLKVASGEALPLKQTELSIHGHAIEVRLYAEDPDNQFLPAIGKIRKLVFPTQSAYVRVDTGVVAGDSISPFYDPMIAKLMTWGRNREEAVQHMRQVLEQTYITGLKTNLAFLHRIFSLAAYQNGHYNTGFIPQNESTLIVKEARLPLNILLAAAVISSLQQISPNQVWQQSRFRLNQSPASQRFDFQFAQHTYAIHLQQTQADHFIACTQDQSIACQAKLTGNQLNLWIDGQSALQLFVDTHTDHLSLYYKGASYDLTYLRGYQGKHQGDGHTDHDIKAPMPGRILAMLCEVGQTVHKGQALLIEEAMKMEHTLIAPIDGIIQAIFYQVGDQVNDGDLLLDLSPLPTENKGQTP